MFSLLARAFLFFLDLAELSELLGRLREEQQDFRERCELRDRWLFELLLEMLLLLRFAVSWTKCVRFLTAIVSSSMCRRFPKGAWSSCLASGAARRGRVA